MLLREVAELINLPPGPAGDALAGVQPVDHPAVFHSLGKDAEA